jgi:flagellin
MIKTSDTWLQKISDMLKTMSSLAVESNDDSKTSVDKNNAQTQFKELQNEIVRITSGSMAAGKFNGKALFQSSTGFNIQAGADAGQTINITFKDMRSNSAQTFSASDGTTVNWNSIVNASGMSIGGGVGSAQMSTNIRNLAAAINFVGNSRAQIGAQSNRLKMTSEALLQYNTDVTNSETRVRGVDIAFESTRLANYQIQMNASSAMLAQGNQLPSSVLQLLG